MQLCATFVFLYKGVEDIFSLKSTATLCFAILKPVHVKMLHQLEENFRAFDFKIIYRKGNEMSSDFSSRQVVNLIQIDNRQMEKDQNWEEWIKKTPDNGDNGSECSHLTAKILTKDFLSKMFFIEDDRHSVGQISNQRRINPSLCCDPSKLDSRNIKVWTWGTLMDMKE